MAGARIGAAAVSSSTVGRSGGCSRLLHLGHRRFYPGIGHVDVTAGGGTTSARVTIVAIHEGAESVVGPFRLSPWPP